VGLTIQLIIAAGLFSTILVFTAAYRFALRESAEARDLAIPRAAIHGGDRRWLEGASRARAVKQVQHLQAVFVALGITGVFVMAVCMAGIVGLMIFG
jgi:hypothetical protein